MRRFDYCFFFFWYYYIYFCSVYFFILLSQIFSLTINITPSPCVLLMAACNIWYVDIWRDTLLSNVTISRDRKSRSHDSKLPICVAGRSVRYTCECKWDLSPHRRFKQSRRSIGNRNTAGRNKSRFCYYTCQKIRHI